MKKIIIKIGTILLSFVLGLIVMSYIYNKGNTDMTGEMAEASLPILYFEDGGELVNPLYGYTGEIDGSCVRGSIMPLDEERILQIVIERYNARIEEVSYEVRSMDMQRLVQDGVLEELQDEGQYLTASLKIKDLLNDGEEYLLILKVLLEDEREVSYFERIANGNREWVQECLAFAMDFHNATLDPDTEYPITQYLEIDSAQSNASFEEVTIHSKYKTVMWGDMAVTQTMEPEISYLEMENDTTALKMEYRVSREDENGNTENYAVEDYFRVRYTERRMYLLDYRRTANRVFENDDTAFYENQLNLGIQSEAINYLVNSEGNVLNFVADGELWSYDSGQNRLASVYSFKNGQDKRGMHDEHEIRMIQIDDTGSMDFAVVGYMNRGRHEGRVGTSIMRYNSLTKTVEELLFLESRDCYEVHALKSGDLLHINREDELFISYGNDIYRIDLNTKEVEILAENLSAACYLISEEGDCLAWQTDNEQYSSRSITTMNMDTGVQNSYTCGEGEYIKPLGFRDTDFVYGIARESDITESFDGSIVFPMAVVRIMDEKGGCIREFDYSANNKYVVGAQVSRNRIELACVSKTAAGQYEEALSEPITSNAEEEAKKIELAYTKHDVKRMEYIFTFQGDIPERKRKVLIPKEILFEENRTMNFETEEETAEYYLVYGQSKMQGIYERLDEAILRAYEVMGSVVDAGGNYVWRRGGRRVNASIDLTPAQDDGAVGSSLEECLQVLLESESSYTDISAELAAGDSAYEILSRHSGKQVISLSGCSLSMVLYYISEGQPVLVLEPSGAAELIVGYDTLNVTIMDAVSGSEHKEGRETAGAKYQNEGCVFISFLE